MSQAIADHLTRLEIASDVAAAVDWRDQVLAVIYTGEVRGRWIPEEAIRSLEGEKPKTNVRARLRGESGNTLAQVLTDDERQAVEFLGIDLRAKMIEVNESILRSELVAEKDFFDKVEHSPLTEEQARAVMCFDNRVQVIAAAGSGKTSVMVARAAYAIKKGFVAPERCLLLAFNRSAAEELQERIDSRLGALGLPNDGLKAATFHSFGLSTIGRATGRKPRLAPWLDEGGDVGMVSRIIDELRDRSLEFRFKWDVYRLLYARMSEKPETAEPDSWDKAQRRAGFQTFRNEVVKSEGERIIADWLFLNGVDYRYEHPYVHDVAGPDHSQYRPDFYYPQIEMWHEHWALDRDGKPPASFTGYASSMEWKKELHRTYGTTLIETTWAQIIDGNGFHQLADDLRPSGVKLDWDPDRPIPGAKPAKYKDLALLMRTFMTHVKSNSLTPESIEKRMADGPPWLRTTRNRWFIDLYWQIHREWQARLEADNSIDFEDMLVRAAEHLEAGEVSSPYDLVLVDEFQDASQARARLARALVAQPGRYLLAVGDDWQSINRFAGADMAVMTEFESWFGRAQTLRLQTTFRCPQSICEVSSSFVGKNPHQLRKQVKSVHVDPGQPVTVVYVDDQEDVPAAMNEYLLSLAARLLDGEIKPGRDGSVGVDILGRYNFDRQLMPKRTPGELNVSFRTVHSSKGLEADYIVVPNVGDGPYGFPSQIVDDPILDLVMPHSDGFPHAEERRLFYVALTRARREVVLVAVRGRESPFIAELAELSEHGLVTFEEGGFGFMPRVCPECRKGMLVERTGPFGQFYGCSRFPACPYRESGAWWQQSSLGSGVGSRISLENPF